MMPAQIPHHIYHFTNINNLGDIARQGLRADTRMGGQYANSGNLEIKERRKLLLIPLCRHGNHVVADYVPFYFAPRSPMLYVQWINGNINNQDIVYLVSSVEHIVENTNYTWCCSNMNAAKNAAKFFDTYNKLLENIDWQLMRSARWNNIDTYPDRKERRMAEFLVYDNVYFVDILKLAVYDASVKERILQILPTYAPEKIHIKEEWYF